MLRIHTPLVTLVLLSLAAGRAWGQTPTLPGRPTGPCALSAIARVTPGAPAQTTSLSPTLALTQSFQSGRWTDLTADVTRVLGTFTAQAGAPCAAPAPAPRVVLVAWIGRTPLGERTLLSAIVPLRQGEAYATRLPGLAGARAGFYQLFVSDSRADALGAAYLSTPVEDPLLAQVPDVAAKVLDPLLALAGQTTSRALTTGKESGAAAAGWATLSRVDLPHERAKVKVQLRAVAALTPHTVTNLSATLRDKLALVEVRYSASARTLASALDRLVQQHADACATEPETCLALLDSEIRRTYDNACPCADDDRKAVQVVDGRFRTMLLTLERTTLDAELQLQNTPLRHASFGVLTGFSFGRSSAHPNVKVDRGVYAHDPLDRQLAMVTFNRSFVPFDDKAFQMDHAERHRWFVGAVVTPTFGLGVGYSYLPIRRLGVNVGYAVLGTSRPAGGRRIGDAPVDANDPFALGVAGTWLVGASFDLK